MSNNKIIIGVVVAFVLLISIALIFVLGDDEEVVIIDDQEEVGSYDEDNEWEDDITEPEKAETSDNWDFSVIEEGLLSANQFSVVVDKDNKLHLAYENKEEDRIEYFYETDSGYKKETVFNFGDSLISRTYPDIVIEDNGDVHIVFLKGREVNYAYQDNGEWKTELLSSKSDQPFITVGGDGNIYTLYGDNYAVLKNGSWNINESVMEVNKGASFAVDSSGNIHVSYYESERGEDYISEYDVYYGILKNGVWSTEQVETGISGLSGIKVILDSSDNPKISYAKGMEDEQGYYNNRPVVASLNNGTWEVDVIEQEKVKEWGSSVIDKDDNIGLAYSSYKSGGSYKWHEILYVDYQRGGLNKEVIRSTAKMEEQEESFKNIDLEVGPGGKFHVVYFLKDSSSDDNIYSLNHLKQK